MDTRLLLQREPSDDQKTFGTLYIDDEYECETLEDVVRDAKIKGETAIPAGRYRITLENSPKFGPGTITVNDVPGFSGVRIHAGNTHKDTHGCPLVGQDRDDAGLVRSRPALAALKPKIAAALQDDGEVWLEIRNA